MCVAWALGLMPLQNAFCLKFENLKDFLTLSFSILEGVIIVCRLYGSGIGEPEGRDAVCGSSSPKYM